MKVINPDVMIKQVNSLGNLVKEEYSIIENRLKNLFTSEELGQFQRIYVFGDGDSWHAAMSTELFFKKHAKVEYFPMAAMHFLEYGADYIPSKFPKSTLVIGVSASGGSKRVVECLERVKKTNPDIMTVGLVGKPDSKVAHLSNRVLSVEIPNFGPSPGIRTFVASMLGLYAIGLAIGEAKKQLTVEETKKLKSILLSLDSSIEKTLKVIDEPCKKAAEKTFSTNFISFVGTGPSFGVAYFSAAKVVEAAGIFAATQDLEEWAHVEGLSYPLEFPVYIVAPKGAGSWRAEKLANYAKLLGHFLIIIADSEDLVMKEYADIFLPIIGDIPEEYSPLLSHLASNLYACYLAKKLNRLPFMADNEEARKRSKFMTQQIKQKN